ncbi:unnamed protein product [Urochloa decumbens]|uniref:RING-type domain-containing protein n=1 Tax=Urochloa decumbens TaxID=240449 RepID=A0ABC8X2P2_9POAL
MGAPRGMARVRRDVLAARFTCPLCHGLLREATAITQCLHTFCRECIVKKINDEDVDCCPVCDIDLGCDPEEKLRPDHNLQDIRNKLFPIKKRKVDSLKAPTMPAKRKQRSLSSLVVDTPSVAMRTGLTGKRTKTTRRPAASRSTSLNNNGTMKLPTKSEGRDQKIEKTLAPQSTKVATTVKKTESRYQKIEKTSAPQSTKLATTAKKNESRDQKKIEKTSAEQSTKVATAANKKQRTTDVEKPSSEDRKNGKIADKQELRKSSNRAASKIKAPRSTPKIHTITEEQIKKKEGELPIRKEETENEVNIPGTRVGEHSIEPSLKEEHNGTSSEPAPLTDQVTEDDSNQGLSGSASTLPDPITTPVWFSLVSSPNQKGDPQLPELSKCYLRIRDGSLQTSSVQRYIAKKLDLGDENEVEITCHGEPISPSSTLHGLVELWLRRREPEERVPASLGATAKEFVMALGYRRRHLPSSVPASPPRLQTRPAEASASCKGDSTTIVEPA